MSGYSVQPGALHRQSKVYDELAHSAEEARVELRAAFDRDRSTLGDDMYGAELAKKLPGMEGGIFAALKTHIDALERVAANLNVSARNYEAVEHPPVKRS
ncbi:hypothetical protein [Microtetraspora malaysiensis]|uniref:hypothetical protein n=1 Tax=Microtetraspora malaysiensis TaxID=161358 RepID=UPI00082F50D8|nr:hypothetical protein [Microtetraspora malaysiensis]